MMFRGQCLADSAALEEPHEPGGDRRGNQYCGRERGRPGLRTDCCTNGAGRGAGLDGPCRHSIRGRGIIAVD